MSVLIGMPTASGHIPASVVSSLLQLQKPVPCSFMTIERQRIDKARNAMALSALEQGCEYLLFVDDDNPIPPDTLTKFIEADKDIILAPILARNPDKEGVHKLCAFYSETVDVKGSPLRNYHPITKFRDEGPLHRVDAGGTGCMLIKRHVLEKLNNKFEGYIFEFGDINVNGQRRTMSEDVEFCERAVDEGFEIWLHEEIRPLHLGSQKVLQYT